MDEDVSEDPKITFNESFARKTKDLEERIGRLAESRAADRQTDIDDLLAAIGGLTHDLKDASNYLPSYDQKIYSEQLKSLSEQLSSVRKALAPRTKFSFKNRRAAAAAEPTVQVTNTPARKVEEPAKTIKVDQSGRASTLTGETAKYLVPPSPVTEESTILSLSSLTGCIVGETKGLLFTNLAVQDVMGSILLCGEIDGPAHLTSLDNSVVVVKCKQFRLHDSRDLDVYLACQSRPIIERCKNVRFAGLPAFFTDEKGEDNGMWRQVDDFNWLKEGKPSPNWRIMEGSEEMGVDGWEEIARKERRAGAPLDSSDEQMLQTRLPRS